MPLNTLQLIAQENGEVGGAASAVILVVYFALIILIMASLWKIFVKAEKPGWAAIIPIYNVIVMLEIVGRPIWWIVLMFIPCVGAIVAIVLAVDLAKSFGKGVGFALGMIFLGFIFYPILGFGDAKYQGPSAS